MVIKKSNKRMWEYILLTVGLFFATGIFWTYMQLTRGYVAKITQPDLATITWPTGSLDDSNQTTTTPSTVSSDNNKTSSEITAEVVADIDAIDKSEIDSSLNDSQLNDLNSQ